MPDYEFRCRKCRRELLLRWRSVADYEAAAPRCPHCCAQELMRLIRQIALARPAARNLAALPAGEMRAILEEGRPQEVGQLFGQVQASAKDE